MNDDVIYKTLKHFKNRDVVTSTELLCKRCFRKSSLESLNFRLSDLHSLNYIDGGKKDGVISARITPIGENFIADYKYQKHLTNREKWFERFIGFVFGVATAVVSGFILYYLGF